jgi:S-adenosylmethionine/arginine decarboxylase-like enzyme
MALEMTKVSTKKMSQPSMEQVLDTLCEMQEDQEVLRQAIHDALLSLGGPITETIIWQLGARGMLLSSHIDVQSFYEHLGQAVGVGADIVMIDVYENVMRMVENT